METYVFLNGEYVIANEAVLSFRDLSMQRGYGIFDFFSVQNGKPVFIEDHLNRLYASAASMHLAIKQSPGELKAIIYDLIQKNRIVNSGIRVTVTGGNSPDGYSLATPNLLVAQQHFTPLTSDQFDKGIRLMTHDHQRQLPHVKTIDYLMAIHLQPRLKEMGADDILYHNNGWIRECPRANFFLITQDEVLVTPSLQILKGITKNKVLSIAKPFMKVEEREINISELTIAKEVFITSSTKKVLPVSQIDEHVFAKDNPVSRFLHSHLTALTLNNLVTAE
jgi:D-alanine transaminase/branched-chain amino acid aminotransferase